MKKFKVVFTVGRKQYTVIDEENSAELLKIRIVVGIKGKVKIISIEEI